MAEEKEKPQKEKRGRIGRKIMEFIEEHDTLLFFVLPSVIGVTIFFLFPLLDVARRSFCFGTSWQFNGIANYKLLFTNKAFMLAAYNTLRFEAICLPLLLLISLLVAIEVYFSSSSVLKFAFLVPLAIPSNSIAVLWRVLFEQQGIVNHILTGVFHMHAVRFLDSSAAFWVLVFTYLWKNIGYNMLIWWAGLAAIPNNVYEAAKLDGASRGQIITRIIVPNLKHVAYAVTVLAFVNSFKVYREAYLIAGNYPDNSMYTLQHLFNNWFQKLDIGKLAAASVVTAAFLFTVLYVLKKLLLKEEDET